MKLGVNLGTPIAALALLGLAGVVAGPAAARPLALKVQPQQEDSLFQQHPWTDDPYENPNVTRSNPMGVVGWDGPPDDVPSVSSDAGPMPPGSIANAPFEGYGFY